MNDTEVIPASWDDLEGVNPPAGTGELLGHDDLLKTLSNNYRQNRLHHAWLLAGQRGIGKSALAFRFAEYLLRYPNAAEAPDQVLHVDDPVHSQVSKGVHPNILVLRRPWDQKSKKFKTQLTVDEIRRLAGFLQSTSGANNWRIVIVDPADDLNNNAANALLKLLEEPPKRTIFFILAHSPRGLLPTIRSRCQVLQARPLSDGDLLTILKTQPLTAKLEDSEAQALVRHAKGSARRALLLADRGVLETWQAFVNLVETKKPDISALHRIAGQLAPTAKSSEYALFMDLVYDHIADRTRNAALNDQVALGHLDALAGVWENTREAVTRAEAWNMDKKQVILDLFRDLRAV